MIANYHQLAEIYNFVMKRVRYDRWSEYLFYLTRPYLPENPRILELAAGNCSLTKLLSVCYKNIYATDLSFTMLNSGDYRYDKICCDMLKLPFRRKFDLIYCTFDSINYLTSRKKLLQLFKEVKSIISDNGIFTFDVSMEKNSLKHIEEPVRHGSYKGVKYIHKSEYNFKNRIHKNIFIFNSPEGRNFREVHRQKIYPFNAYFEVIPRSGLYVSACYNAFSFDNGSSDSERLQFILKKANSDAFIN